MNLLKKYHLWWLIAVTIVAVMSVDFVLFAFFGIPFIKADSPQQAFAQAVIFAASIFLTAVGFRDSKK